ncbi:NB-ARC domain-containing protein [Ancylothrix sp. C2]|uniref:NB-ARC domain-containing protein n=1 Tax=Ancylothrix sp. D3o TaxID=2953691 RepID=UPI0021BAA4D2|nr:NB-ARC domain-containing protein [Ancylothrix sp. D3o]MCT7953415.1 NB-ARC domain-containing protein [Ancylothrix sp. D3o]
MDIQEVLNWTDEKVFAKTGKHLDSIQKAILEGIWQHQQYGEIAENNNFSYDYLKKEAWKLWKLLSNVLGEDNIKKSNVRSILEKKALSRIYNNNGSQIVGYINSHINICGENRPYPEETKPPSPSPPNTPQNENKSPIIDLKQAPALTEYYHRTPEETTLKNWILNTTTRLITIYGLNGIGKSTLTLQLIQQINNEFDYIIWQTLNEKPTLTTLQTHLKQTFSHTQKNPLTHNPRLFPHLSLFTHP